MTKLAILSQSKPLFWQNLPLWIILSLSGVKQFEKVEKLKKFADVPQRTKTFEILKNEMLWWQKTGKVVNQVKLAIPSQSEPDFRQKMEKPAKWPKLAIWSQSKPLFWQNLPLWVTFTHFSVKCFEEVEKLKKNCQCISIEILLRYLSFHQFWS